MIGDFADESLGRQPSTRGRQKRRTTNEQKDSHPSLLGLGLGDLPHQADFDTKDRDTREDFDEYGNLETDPFGDSARVEPMYKGLILKPKSITKSKLGDWSIATKHEVPSTQKDLEAEVKKRRNSKKPGVSAEFGLLTTEQQKVINRLVESYAAKEENPYATWSLVLINRILERDGWGKILDTKSIQITLKRQDRDADKLGEYDHQRQRSSSDEDEIDINKPRDSNPRSSSWRGAGSFGSRGQERLQRDLNKFRMDDDRDRFDRDNEYFDGPSKSQGKVKRSKSRRDNQGRDSDDFYQDSSQFSPMEWPEGPSRQDWPQEDDQDFQGGPFVPREAQPGKKSKKNKNKTNGRVKQNVQIDDNFAGLDFQANIPNGPNKHMSEIDNLLSKFPPGDANGQSSHFADDTGPSHQQQNQGWPNDFKGHDIPFVPQQPQTQAPHFASFQPQQGPPFNGPQFRDHQVPPAHNQQHPAVPEMPPFNGGNQPFSMPGGWQDTQWDNRASGSQNTRPQDPAFGQHPHNQPMPFQQNSNYPDDLAGPNGPSMNHPFEPFPHIQSQPQNSARYPDPLHGRSKTPDWQHRESSRRRRTSRSRDRSSDEERRGNSRRGKTSRSRDRSSSQERQSRSRRSSSGKKEIKKLGNKLDELVEKLERMHASPEPSESRSEGSTAIFSEPYADRAFTPPSTPPRSPTMSRGSLYRRDSTKKQYRPGYRGRHGKAESVDIFPAHSAHDRRNNVLADLMMPRLESSRGKRPVITRHSESYDDYPRGMLEDRYSPERPPRIQRRLTDYEERGMYEMDLPEIRRQREAAEHIQDRRRSAFDPAIRQAYHLGRTHERGQYGYERRYLE